MPVYLMKETIVKDLNKFTFEINRGDYGVMAEVLDEPSTIGQRLGYTMTAKGGRKYEVFMIYKEDEYGDLGTDEKFWTVEVDNERVAVGLHTLGEVFAFIKEDSSNE